MERRVTTNYRIDCTARPQINGPNEIDSKLAVLAPNN